MEGGGPPQHTNQNNKQMFNFKTIATAAFVATSILCVADAVTPQAAKADVAPRCGNIAGYPVCAYDREFIDTLEIQWTDGDWTSIGVECQAPGGAKWESAGYWMGRSEVNKVVRGWCF